MAEYRTTLPHSHSHGAHRLAMWRLDGSSPVAPPDVSPGRTGQPFWQNARNRSAQRKPHDGRVRNEGKFRRVGRLNRISHTPPPDVARALVPAASRLISIRFRGRDRVSYPERRHECPAHKAPRQAGVPVATSSHPNTCEKLRLNHTPAAPSPDASAVGYDPAWLSRARGLRPGRQAWT